MINPFVIKKYVAMMLVGFCSVIGFAIGVMFYNFWVALILFFVCMLVSMVLANLLLKNPFTSLLEGEGLLAINLDSTGIMTPFIFQFKTTSIWAKFRGQEVNDSFDRKAVMQMSAPTTVKEPIIDKDGKLTITLDRNFYNNARFQLYQYPTLLYNAQIRSIITKDFIAEKEKDAMAEHTILYLNRTLEELTSSIRNFGRYVVDTLKPSGSIFDSKWTWIILAIGIGALVILFAPAIVSTVQGFLSPAGDAVAAVSNNAGVITPRG